MEALRRLGLMEFESEIILALIFRILWLSFHVLTDIDRYFYERQPQDDGI